MAFARPSRTLTALLGPLTELSNLYFYSFDNPVSIVDPVSGVAQF